MTKLLEKAFDRTCYIRGFKEAIYWTLDKKEIFLPVLLRHNINIWDVKAYSIVIAKYGDNLNPTLLLELIEQEKQNILPLG